MRTTTALALALVAATAATATSAGAAPARRPAGVTFTDPAGDANALDGANNAGSQAALDIVKVRLLPFDRTKSTSGITVAVELGAAPLMAPGTSYALSATQSGCTISISRTVTAEGVSSNALTVCGTAMGGYRHDNDGHAVVSGKSLVFNVPAIELFDDSVGAGLKDVEVSTSVGDPAFGMGSPPRRVDRAVYTGTYRLGS